MAENQSPRDWLAPVWHPDAGDARGELEHLRSLAIALSEAIPGVKTVLEVPEPGLMYVRVDVPGGITCEIYSVEPIRHDGDRRYGLFILSDTQEEVEEYSESIDMAVALLAMHAKVTVLRRVDDMGTMHG